MYQSVVMQHFKAPFQILFPEHAGTLSVNNPLCGDEVTIKFWRDMQHAHYFAQARGCALCIASASILSQAMHREGSAALLELIPGVIEALQPGVKTELGVSTTDRDILALLGARYFPVRLKCVRLPWEALLESTSVGGLTHPD